MVSFTIWLLLADRRDHARVEPTGYEPCRNDAANTMDTLQTCWSNSAIDEATNPQQ